jgi:hypothetical protein
MDTISGFSGKSYEKIVQKKDPGIRENGVHGARSRWNRNHERMNDEQDIPMEKSKMSKIMNVTENEAAKLVLEGKPFILGGIEVHVRFESYKGDSSIRIDYTLPFGPKKYPYRIQDINDRLARLCPSMVMNMNEYARKRAAFPHQA